MTSRLVSAFFLLATTTIAANLPRFVFSAAGVQNLAEAVDPHGNTYLTGQVSGNAFTATPGAFQSQYAGGTCYGGGGIGPPSAIPCHNAYVIKLDPAGAVVFATYLGGTGSASGVAITVDSQENVYVTGTVDACCFPFTSGAAFGNDSIPQDGFAVSFIAKLNSAGSQLDYATLIPGSYLTAIAADDSGDLFFTGFWDGPGANPFPATPGAYQTNPKIPATAASQGETVVGKLNPAGSALIYGTYLSGSLGTSEGMGIAVDSSGDAIVAGNNSAPDFPATTGALSGNPSAGFLAKFTPDGSALIYATLLGPGVAAMKVAADGDIYLACQSFDSAFPVTAPGFGVAPPASGSTNFLLRVSADASALLSSVYLPFVLYPYGGMDLDSAGNAYIAGTVQSAAPFPMSPGAFQSTFSGAGQESVIAKITPGGQVAGVSYFGGSGEDEVSMIGVESDGSVVVAGSSASTDFLGIPPPSGSTSFFVANFFPAITIENSASYVANTAVPGALMSMQGYGIGPAAGLTSSPVDSLGGVQVYFDNFSAPITYAQSNQINVQVPWEIAGQAATQVRIVYNGVNAGLATVPVSPALPGVFYINNSDGSRNSPSNPAKPGDFVAVYGTGGGLLSPPGVTGNAWPLSLSYLTQPVSVTVGGEPAGILYPGSAPTLDSGFFQINVRLPSDLTSAAQVLSVTIGGVTGASTPIAIQ